MGSVAIFEPVAKIDGEIVGDTDELDDIGDSGDSEIAGDEELPKIGVASTTLTTVLGTLTLVVGLGTTLSFKKKNNNP